MKKFKIHFGDTKTSIFTIDEIKTLKNKNIDHLNKKLESLKIFENNARYIFLDQIHSANGHLIKDFTKSFLFYGDFLITNKKNLAISILTADCLPIIFYDKKNHVAAIAHSGWRGTLQKIANKAFNVLNKNFETLAYNTQVFLGPCAKKCCYEVSKDFAIEFNDSMLEKTVFKENGKHKFDNVLYTVLELHNLNIPSSNINLEYNICTMCDKKFGSFRRLGLESPLNISSIVLE